MLLTHKIFMVFKVLVVVTFIFFTKNVMAYDSGYLSYKNPSDKYLPTINVPTNDNVLVVLRDVYKDKYRDSFEVKSFLRINGYKKSYLYLVTYNITLSAKKDINLSQHYTDIPYFTRLVKLKKLNVLSKINKGESFDLKNESIELIKSEKGWVEVD